jgi:hypothetical protein
MRSKRMLNLKEIPAYNHQKIQYKDANADE